MVCLLSTRSSGAERTQGVLDRLFLPPELRSRKFMSLRGRRCGDHHADDAFRDVFDALSEETLCIAQGASSNHPDPARCDEVVDH